MRHEYEEEEEYGTSHMNPTVKKVLKGMKWFFVVLIILINALLLWRVFFSDIVPTDAETLAVNEATAALYAQKGENMVLFTQDNDGISAHESDAGYTCFWVKQVVYIPEAKQIQVLVAYNVSALRTLREDFGLEKTPDRKEDVVDVTLVVTADPTPDNPDDGNKTKVRYTATARVYTDETLLYNYSKFIFDNVEFDGPDVAEEDRTTLDIAVQFYYKGRVNYNLAPYCTMSIYNSNLNDIPLSLSKKDKAALEAFGK